MNILAKVVRKMYGVSKYGLVPYCSWKYYQKLFNRSPSIFLQVSFFVSFSYFFEKARTPLQLISQAFIILYMFSPFSFVFKNASTEAKIFLQISFFTETCFFLLLLPWRNGVVDFSVKQNNLMLLKRNVVFLFSLIVTQKFERLFSVR